MQVTKITEKQQIPTLKKKVYTQDEMQREYNYFLAQKMLELLLDKDMISVDELNKITALNRQTFSPYLAEIMPINR